MKRGFIFFLFLTLVACNKASQDGVSINESEIIGRWQIVSETYSIGGPQIDVKIKNGSIYNFALNGTFDFNSTQEATLSYTGTYDFEDEILTLNYVYDDENLYRDLSTSFNGNEVTMYPIGPIICIEGCSFTLRRLE